MGKETAKRRAFTSRPYANKSSARAPMLSAPRLMEILGRSFRASPSNHARARARSRAMSVYRASRAEPAQGEANACASFCLYPPEAARPEDNQSSANALEPTDPPRRAPVEHALEALSLAARACSAPRARTWCPARANGAVKRLASAADPKWPADFSSCARTPSSTVTRV